MAGSLLLLLDDIAGVLDDVATMTKVAATKTAGVIGDDLALNARQVAGVGPARELPVVWGVARGSASNKLLLVPAAVALSWAAPWAIPPLLIAGGAFLCYEGAEKILHGMLHRRQDGEHAGHRPAGYRPAGYRPAGSGAAGPTGDDGQGSERERIAAAVRTDFILSAEIIVIALGVVAGKPLVVQLAVLAAISAAMTVGVYGLVAAIVKLDDLGASLAGSTWRVARAIGRGIVAVAPWLMRGLSVAGTVAMFLVGGGIIVHALPAAHGAVHDLLGEVGLPWLSFAVEGIAGLVVGLLLVGGTTLARTGTTFSSRAPAAAAAPPAAMVARVVSPLVDRVRRLVMTCYEPDPDFADYLSRAVTQHDPRATLTVAVPAAAEAKRLFGADVAARGIQPVFVRVENRSPDSLRLQMVSIDPRYFTPLEAAGLCHSSFVRRLTAFGAMGWLFLPLLAAAPLKLFTAYLANGAMDDFFRARGFPLGPIAPGGVAEGFVFTTPDLGTKVVPVRLTTLHSFEQSFGRAVGGDMTGGRHPSAADGGAAGAATVDFVFTLSVPGIVADYLGRDFSRLVPPGSVEPCTVETLVQRLEALPPATADATESRRGDPVNLVVIGEFETLLGCFAARWDESETITLATCWKTAWAFLSGTNYRYSPVSALHLFRREQDIALQRTRHSIDERLHLRLWLAPLELLGRPVWVGQVSRDIGVRFTTRAWNLTTHRIDPNVDESRDYVIEDLTVAGRVAAVGYVGGVGLHPRTAPGRNLTGDPYFTDGRRAVILLAANRNAGVATAGCRDGAAFD